MIDMNGGAQSSGGDSRNLINGVDRFVRSFFTGRANAEFGGPPSQNLSVLARHNDLMTKSISNNDYQSLRAFVLLFIEYYLPETLLLPESPTQRLEKIEATSLSSAKRNLLSAVNDFIEWSFDWPPEQIAEADKRFAAAGTFTLSELRHRHSKKYQQILKRGTIRNETEYYLIKGVLDDGFVELGTPEADQLQEMLDTYEDRVVKKSNP